MCRFDITSSLRLSHPTSTIDQVTLRADFVRPADAFAALRGAVDRGKAGAPLSPVTVIVPTNATGVMARRHLGRHGGVAAVDMLTLYRLAELLGGPSLVADHRRPVSTPIVDLAVRAVLAERPGGFARVAEHPSTVVALRDLHRELRMAGPASATALAGSSDRGREAATISTLTTRRLEADWYDEGDLLARSIEATATGVPARLERVVVFLPHPIRGLDAELLRALAEHADVNLLLAASGEPASDAEMVDTAAALGTIITPPAPAALHTARIDLVSTTDADEEVRHAIRCVVDAARDGVAFARMAILWPTDRPYARLVEHHLTDSEIPWNGRPGTAAAERLVPRFLLDLLDVDRRGLRRRDLFDLLADLPMRTTAGAPVPIARWERVSREAGVTRDDEWGTRLGAYAARQRARDAELEADVSYRADDAESLIEYVADLRRALGPRSRIRPWADWADWAEQQISQRLGRAFLDRLSEPERLAAEHTDRVLDRIRHLDAIGDPVRRSEFRSVFAAEFDVAPGRLGRIGSGVTVGSLSGAVGLDVDLAIVLGAADGSMPPAPHSGPLVSDADRRRSGLSPADAIGHRMHRQFRSVLDTATRSVVLVPRGDLRATTIRQPSRWLEPFTTELAVRPISSHHAAVASVVFPANPHEHRLRGLLAEVAGSGPLVSSTDPALARALALRAGRRSSTLTVFDGDLSSIDLHHFDRAVAPTQLEQWAACPHGYFMRYVLGVYPVEEPADQMEITGMERGNLIHLALDRFHREVIAGALPQPSGGWADIHWARLNDLFDAAADEFEHSGRTGRDASWHVERETTRADLSQWFARDSPRLASRGATIVSSEQSFGYDSPVELPLPDGGRLAVRGHIDRVDQTAEGHLLVTDHKTGGSDMFRPVEAEPTAGGTKFQLPAYAAGALAARGIGVDRLVEHPVWAEYSFFKKGGYKRPGHLFDADAWAVVTADLGEVVDGVRAGYFPARPDEPGFQLWVNCHYCQPDGLGTGERYPEWDVKRHDPRLARWFAEPVDEEPGA